MKRFVGAIAGGVGRWLPAVAILGGVAAASAQESLQPVMSPDGKSIISHSGPRADPPGSNLGPTPIHPKAAAGLAMPYAGTAIDVTTFHNDNLRTGWNRSEAALTPANVRSGSFGLLKTLAVDGNVFAQPLVVSGFPMPSGSVDAARQARDVLVIATGHNTVYAFDAQTYDVLWQRNLGTAQSSTDVGCSDVVPEYGISSTPVIVREGTGRASIYVVASTEPSPLEFHTTLHRLNLANGSDVVAPVDINPTATLSDGSTIGYDSKNQWNRAALTWANNSLYVGITSHCDNNAGAITGWLLRYGPKLTQLAAFNTVDDQASYKLSSIWGSGFGPAADLSGNIYAVTGNGAFDGDQGGHNYGESVISLTPSLGAVRSSFTPGNYGALNNEDRDLGSGGVMLMPPLGSGVPPLAVVIGKDPYLFLLNRSALGGYSTNNTGALQVQSSQSQYGVWGGPAYYGSPDGPMVYLQASTAMLKGYAVSATATPTLTPTLTGTSGAAFGGSMPVVSSNGSTPGTGVVWLVRRTTTPQLEAYDASVLGAPIYSATAGTWSSTHSNAYLTPTVANGRVYVGVYLTVAVFGLTP